MWICFNIVQALINSYCYPRCRLIVCRKQALAMMYCLSVLSCMIKGRKFDTFLIYQLINGWPITYSNSVYTCCRLLRSTIYLCHNKKMSSTNASYIGRKHHFFIPKSLTNMNSNTTIMRYFLNVMCIFCKTQ